MIICNNDNDNDNDNDNNSDNDNDININIIINPYLVEVGLLVEHCASAESQIASIDDPGIAGDSDLRWNYNSYNIIIYHISYYNMILYYMIIISTIDGQALPVIMTWGGKLPIDLIILMK